MLLLVKDLEQGAFDIENHVAGNVANDSVGKVQSGRAVQCPSRSNDTEFVMRIIANTLVNEFGHHFFHKRMKPIFFATVTDTQEIQARFSSS
jgi:hypothetical protein